MKFSGQIETFHFMICNFFFNYLNFQENLGWNFLASTDKSQIFSP